MYSNDPWPHIVTNGVLTSNNLEKIVGSIKTVEFSRFQYKRTRVGTAQTFSYRMNGFRDKLDNFEGHYELNDIMDLRQIHVLWDSIKDQVFDNYNTLTKFKPVKFTEILISYHRVHGTQPVPYSRYDNSLMDNILMLELSKDVWLSNTGISLYSDQETLAKTIPWSYNSMISYCQEYGSTWLKQPPRQDSTTRYFNIQLR